MAKNGTNGTATLRTCVDTYVEHLRAIGKAGPTVRSYSGDLQMALIYFGGRKEMGKFLKAHVARFLASELFNKKKSGEPKGEVTITKSRRAVRQFFEWAVAQGHMERVPFPGA